MKNPFSSLFSRILLSSVIPFAIVIAIILFTVRHVIYSYSDARLKETVTLSARGIADRIADSLAGISGLINLTSTNMAEAAANSEASRLSEEHILYSLMEANRDIYCAWYIFEAGVVNDKGSDRWYGRAFVRKGNEVTEIPGVSDKDLDVSVWHTLPFESGKPWQDAGGFWDYGLGEGPKYIAAIVYPIVKGGVSIGTIGMDVTYDHAFTFLRDLQADGNRKILLISDTGVVVYSDAESERGKDFRELGFEPADADAFAGVLRGGPAIFREIQSPFFNAGSLVHLSPVDIPDTERKVYLYFGSRASLLYRQVDSILAAIAGICALGLLLLAGSAFLTSRNIADPIRRITRFASRVASGELDISHEELPDHGGVDEVDALGTSMKTMLEQLGEQHELKMIAMQAEFDKKKVEEASREKTLFFANMSHEIRTPMNAIMGLSDLLLAERLTPPQARQVGQIKTASESLLVIIDDILDISRIESGKLTLVEGDFDFSAMLDNIASICGHLASRKQLRFAVEKRSGVPDYIYGDEIRLRQVLLNLLGNAIKFTEVGGVTLGVAGGSDTLRFEVTDTGIGIKPEDKERLFNSFQQFDQHKNRNIRGSGLGLSIAKNLVTIMGGNIDCDSAYGEGTTFRVSVPLREGEGAKVRARRHGVDTDFRVSAHALVVDDNAVNLLVAEGLLKHFGVTADTASSGREAVEKVQENAYDLVFMDHMMPEMDGEEATRAIRALGGEFATLPVVALTANAVTGVKERLFAAGMNDYLAKPIKKELLREVLNRWLVRQKNS